MHRKLPVPEELRPACRRFSMTRIDGPGVCPSGQQQIDHRPRTALRRVVQRCRVIAGRSAGRRTMLEQKARGREISQRRRGHERCFVRAASRIDPAAQRVHIRALGDERRQTVHIVEGGGQPEIALIREVR